jgi:hypothetical protein
MSLPIDAYPLATQDGQQIRLDLVRIVSLDSVAFTSTAGTALNAALLTVDAIYVFFATTDCIIRFNGVASKTLSATPAVLVAAGERVTCLLPIGATGLSVIGISVGGTLYIQQVAAFAGLANDTTLGNQ